MHEMNSISGLRLVHGNVYTFRLRVSDGQRWSCWTEYSPPMQVRSPGVSGFQMIHQWPWRTISLLLLHWIIINERYLSSIYCVIFFTYFVYQELHKVKHDTNVTSGARWWFLRRSRRCRTRRPWRPFHHPPWRSKQKGVIFGRKNWDLKNSVLLKRLCFVWSCFLHSCICHFEFILLNTFESCKVCEKWLQNVFARYWFFVGTPLSCWKWSFGPQLNQLGRV